MSTSGNNHCGEHVGLADQATCGLWLRLGGSAQANQVLEDHKAEWDHGKTPPHPTASWVVLDLTRVAEEHQTARKETEGGEPLRLVWKLPS